MNTARASGAFIVASLGGVRRSLRRLSRRDFGTLIERMPVKSPEERMYLTPFDVHRWSQTVAGAAAVIALASLPKGPTPEQVDARIAEIEGDEDGSAWGSMVQQTVAAGSVTAESLISGDEPQPDEGEQRSDPPRAITPTKPG